MRKMKEYKQGEGKKKQEYQILFHGCRWCVVLEGGERGLEGKGKKSYVSSDGTDKLGVNVLTVRQRLGEFIERLSTDRTVHVFRLATETIRCFQRGHTHLRRDEKNKGGPDKKDGREIEQVG